MIEIKQLSLKSTQAKNFYETMQFHSFILYEWAMLGAPKMNQQQIFSLMNQAPRYIYSDSDLHLALNTVVPKQNAMIEGKYKKARLYLFETQSLVFAARCETGDRGSSWAIASKMNNPIDFFDVHTLSDHETKEIGQFFRSLTYLVLSRHPASHEEAIGSCPEFVNALFKEAEVEKFYFKLQEEVPNAPMESKARMKI